MEYNVDKLRGSILDEDNVLYIQNESIKPGLIFASAGHAKIYAFDFVK